MNRILSTALLVFASLLLAACNPNPSPQEILVRATENNGSVQTAEMSMRLELTIEQQDLLLAASAKMDKPNQRILVELTDLQVPDTLFGSSMTAQDQILLQQIRNLKVLVAGGTFYMKMDALGPNWVDYETLSGGQAAPPTASYFITPTVSREMAEKLVQIYSDPELKGIENLYGVDCYHITSGFDLKKALELFDDLLGAQLPVDRETKLLLSQLKIEIEQWISKDGFILRKAIYRGSLPALQGAEMTVWIEYPAIDQPVQIADPKNIQQ